MREALVLLVSFIASIVLSVWIVRRDIARLRSPELDRAWPDASVLAAAAWFAPLCIVIHFVRTRRSIRGVALGIGWLLVALVALECLARLAELVAGFLRN